MPEGPEYKYLAELLVHNNIIGKTLINIEALSKTKVKLPNELHIKDIITKGKLLVLVSNDYYVHITLGIAGWITFQEPKYTKYIFEFNNTTLEKPGSCAAPRSCTKFYLDDMRKFSKVMIYNKKQHDNALIALGIDFMTDEFTLNLFKDKIKNVSKNICAFLMDQHVISGIGNYNKNESLYIAKISPYRNTSDLDDVEIAKLHKALIYVGFSTFYEMMKGEHLKIPDILKTDIKLQVPYKYRVYELEHDLKGNKVKFVTVAGRNTYYVESIQK